MPTVSATSYPRDGRRIIFAARGRSLVNVRETRDDGPLGFSSGELLLIALGNCALGTILESPDFEDVNVSRVELVLHSDPEKEPYRLGPITLEIAMEGERDLLDERKPTIEALARNCPIANTLRSTPSIEIVFITG